MKIRDVMTKNPIVLKHNDTLKKAMVCIARHKISGCPVVNSRKSVVGIVSQADIVKLIDVYSKINMPESLDFVFSLLKSKDVCLKKELKNMQNIKIYKIMKRGVITVDINDDFYKAARLINKHDIDRLPVVKNNKLVGIITRADIIKALEKLEGKKEEI
jgi:CBS domain-containing protein